MCEIMTRTLSPRAQEILAALEREAAARSSDARSPVTPPQAAEPAPERGEPAPDLPTLVDAALVRTELARQRLSVLAEAVEESGGRIDAVNGGGESAPAPPARSAPAEAPTSPPDAELPAQPPPPYEVVTTGDPAASEAPAAASPAEAGGRRISNRAARRLAVDRATGGASRDAVGDWLRSHYGITDPGPTLDLVFGVGTDGGRGGLRADAAPAPLAQSEVETADPIQREPLRAAGPVAAKQPAASTRPEAGASLLRAPAFEVIDVHHHLLPGIDDGPPTLDDALALARVAFAAGTTTVVATPHVARGHPANTAASIADGVAALQDALIAADIPLRVLPGAEVALPHAVDLSDEELTALRLNGGPYLLIESPLAPTGSDLEHLLEALLERGHRILLAHPERCPAFQRDNELLARLVARGVLSQITASSLTGGFGRTAREVAHGLIRDGLAHVVASDAHSVDRRPPSLLPEIEQEGYAEQAAWLVSRIPRAILDGDPVPTMPAVPSEIGSGSAAPDGYRQSRGSALQLAVDLAAAGESRGSVGDWLRSLYGIPDPTSTLDSVFGVGTTDEERSTLHRKATSAPPVAARPVVQGAMLATAPSTFGSSAVREAAAAERPEAGASLLRAPAFEVIDVHHHLLPGLDDGPPTLDDALALARAAVAAGTTTVVATPHVSWGYPANTAASIAEHVSALEDALAEASIPLRVLPGAEVAMTHAVDLSDEELTALHLGGGPYLLVECPLTGTAVGFELLLGSLLDRGHRILLAHPERCRGFQRDNELLARLVSRGALSQITASSLSGCFGRTVREVAHGLVREGLVHVVASDAHSVDRRPPSLLAEVEQEGYAEQAAWLVGQVPRAILDGSRVPIMPVASPRPRQGLKRLLGRSS